MNDIQMSKLESEMSRFEEEISSLTSSTPSFVPQQVKKPVVISAPPVIKKPPVSSDCGNPANRPGLVTAKQSHVTTGVASTTTSSTTASSHGDLITTTIKVNSLDEPSDDPSSVQTKPEIPTATAIATGSIPGIGDKLVSSTPEITITAKRKKKEKKPKKFIRSGGGDVWEDTTLLDWDPNDFRLFCGDLGNDVTDEVLTRVFGRYPSFQKAKVIRDKRTNKTKGYGFVSFKDPNDFVRAIKELDGRYVGSRPIKLRKSTWRNRNFDQVKKKEREAKQLLGIVTKR